MYTLGYTFKKSVKWCLNCCCWLYRGSFSAYSASNGTGWKGSCCSQACPGLLSTEWVEWWFIFFLKSEHLTLVRLRGAHIIMKPRWKKIGILQQSTWIPVETADWWKAVSYGAFMHNHSDKMTSPVRRYLINSTLFCCWLLRIRFWCLDLHKSILNVLFRI